MRSTLYLIAAGLFQAPEPDTLCRTRELVSAVLEADPPEAPWRRRLNLLSDQLGRGAGQLAVEYTRLFVLDMPHVAAQPFASFWLDESKLLMGRSTVAVRQMMAEHGIRADGGLLPDHIVCELEFMAWLAHREAEEATRGTQRRFLTEHLSRWTPHFTAALREARPSPLFIDAADFLDHLIGWDLEHFASEISASRHSLAEGAVP